MLRHERLAGLGAFFATATTGFFATGRGAGFAFLFKEGREASAAVGALKEGRGVGRGRGAFVGSKQNRDGA